MPKEQEADSIDALQNEMHALLGRLQRCFKLTQEWPAMEDLTRLRQLIECFYLAAGHKKIHRSKFWNMVEAVDRRWQGFHLNATITKLIERFKNMMPLGPLTKLWKRWGKINNGGTLTPAQSELHELLRKADVAKNEALWTKFSDDLNTVLTTDTAKSLGGPVAVDSNAHAWIKFIDVHRQVISWRLQFEKLFDHFAHWVHALRNDDLTEKIEMVSWAFSRPISAKDLLAADKRRNTNARQTRHRLRASKKAPTNRG